MQPRCSSIPAFSFWLQALDFTPAPAAGGNRLACLSRPIHDPLIALVNSKYWSHRPWQAQVSAAKFRTALLRTNAACRKNSRLCVQGFRMQKTCVEPGEFLEQLNAPS